MAKSLIPRFSSIVITTPGTYKVSEPEKVYDIFKSVLIESALSKSDVGARSKIEFIKNTEEGIRRGLEIARQKKLPLLGTGSFYLAGEIRNCLFPKREP
jgi:dihydrofolate synthase/folylpolyglutamate synthase